MPRTPASTNAADRSITPAEREVLELFVHLGKYLSLPRSVGEIYGLLFATGGQCTLDDLVSRLGISKGSASQGLRMLRGAGAVRAVHRRGDRKDYFEAEADFPALVRGFLRDQLAMRMEHAGERLAHLREVVDDPRNGAPAGLPGRVAKLQSWHGKARKILPVLTAFLRV